MKRSTVCRTVFPISLPQLGSIIGQFFSQLAGIVGYFFSSFTDGSLSFGQIYTGIIRWVMPLLALHILITVLRSMLRVRNPKETWGYLLSPDLGNSPSTTGNARWAEPSTATSGSNWPPFQNTMRADPKR